MQWEFIINYDNKCAYNLISAESKCYRTLLQKMAPLQKVNPN